MPHVEIKYSDNLDINVQEIFDCIETKINQIDPLAGDCKSRAYPANNYKHTHVLINITMLKKDYRDDKFTQLLIKSLVDGVKSLIKFKCYFSLNLEYSGGNYITTTLN